jgi:hypothetical protein
VFVVDKKILKAIQSGSWLCLVDERFFTSKGLLKNETETRQILTTNRLKNESDYFFINLFFRFRHQASAAMD